VAAEVGTFRHRALIQFLHASGYDDTLLETEFPLPLRHGLQRLDVVAFGRPTPHDMTTATVVGEVVGPEAIGRQQVLDGARSLAAPLAVLDSDDVLELWRVGPGADLDARLGEGSDPGELAGRFSQISEPGTLLAAKNGRQLTLFPVDASLLARARRGSTSVLSELITEAMLALIAGRKDLRTQEWQEVVRLVVQSLAALVVRDKFELPGTGAAILDSAAFKFPGFFVRQRDLSDVTLALMSQTIRTLEQGVNYRALDSAVVSRVYEDTVVSTAARAKQGIYYTPPELAERILANVPFEEIAPDERVVLDPACGSGTLLLAAHDRLSQLLPAEADTDHRQAYLRAHLIGLDSDPFAAEIAKLSLLLHSLPFGNHWQVETRDALKRGGAFPRKASVVVSNPPWRGRRSVNSQRSEEALAFLARMIDLTSPGGFLAAVLPASWLQSKVSAASRRHLADVADIFEVWRLPEGTFESASLAPCVVFARVGVPSRQPWVYRRVREQSLERFYQTGVADEALLSSHSTENSVRAGYMRGPLDSIADQLAALRPLSEIAEVESSPVPEPQRHPEGDGNAWMLGKAGDFRAFKEPPSAALIRVRYPEDFHRAGVSRLVSFARPKVLLSSKRSPATPWRLKVGLDQVGLIPRESMHFAVPRSADKDELFGLLALLGSRFASVWVDSYEPKRTISISLVRALPVPPAGPTWKLLADVGRRLNAAPDGAETTELARAADALVEVAFGLPDAVRRQLDAIFAGQMAPEGVIRYQSPASRQRQAEGTIRDQFGAVLAVEPPLLRLWIPGLTPEEGTWSELPDRFPGWLCRDEATFDVRVAGSLQDAEFRLQRRAYMDVDPLTEPLPIRSK
jgi:predicted RNA methylase